MVAENTRMMSTFAESCIGAAGVCDHDPVNKEGERVTGGACA